MALKSLNGTSENLQLFLQMENSLESKLVSALPEIYHLLEIYKHAHQLAISLCSSFSVISLIVNKLGMSVRVLTVKHENNANMKQMRPLRPFCRSH